LKKGKKYFSVQWIMTLFKIPTAATRASAKPSELERALPLLHLSVVQQLNLTPLPAMT
jgi:hypothetical protein